MAALARERGEEGVDKSVAAATDAETSTDASDTEARKNAGMVPPPDYDHENLDWLRFPYV
eukprot:COSAG01_NODE_26499_length_711_cov_0.946166_2_plen_59_part_01